MSVSSTSSQYQPMVGQSNFSLNQANTSTGNGPLAMSGLATGLDTSTIIQEMMSIARRPEQLMQQQQQQDQNVLTQYQTLNTNLMSLQSAAQTLMGADYNLSPFGKTTATSSNNAVMTATTSAGAAQGSYNITVNNLATAQKIGGTFAAPTSATTLQITPSGGSTVNVAITAGMTASAVASAINGANAGMSATVVNGNLILTGQQTGVSYTVTDTSSDAVAKQMGISSAADTYQTAQQASLTVDGKFTVNSNTNTFTNALSGVTINAVATGSATMTVGQDTQTVTSDVQAFISAYNAVVSQVNQNSSYNTSNKQAGVFLGDSTVHSIMDNLNRMVTGVVDPKDTTTYNNSTELGISVNTDGTLSLDTSKFQQALSANPQKVYQFFSNEDNATKTDANGFTVKLNDFGNTSTGAIGDGIANRISAFIDSAVNATSMYNFTTNAAGTRGQGLLMTAIQGEQANISDLNAQIANFEQQMTLQQEALQKQFSFMETSVNSLRSQGSYLSAQAASMASSSGATSSGASTTPTGA